MTNVCTSSFTWGIIWYGFLLCEGREIPVFADQNAAPVGISLSEKDALFLKEKLPTFDQLESTLVKVWDKHHE